MSLGYTQGLNFVTGTALVHMHAHEQNTFWFMVAVLCELRFGELFDFSSQGRFRILCYQLEACTQVFLPQVYAHLIENGIPIDIYASNWFLTMFCNDLPFDMAPAILDVFLLESFKGLIRIAISLLSLLWEHIKVLTTDKLMVFMS